MELAAILAASQTEMKEFIPLTFTDDYFPEYITKNYLLDPASLQDGVILYPQGMFAHEIAILHLGKGVKPDAIQKNLKDYIAKRSSAFSGYAPYQAAILEKGVVVVQGSYIALIIVENIPPTAALFAACFSNTPPAVPAYPYRHILTSPPREEGNATEATTALPAGEATVVLPETKVPPEPSSTLPPSVTSPPTALPPEATVPPLPSESVSSTTAPVLPSDVTLPPPPTLPVPSELYPPASAADPVISLEDIYDGEAVLAAWFSGDPQGLSPLNLVIYSLASQVMADYLKEGMTPAQQQLIIHDWIIDNVDYDTEANNNAPTAKPDPNNYNPYGALQNGLAICSGFSSTFQLFMDMLAIECITIHGTNVNGDPHAWNMVRLDGKWLCVDVTWDDPVIQGDIYISWERRYRYYNVSSDFMWYSGHRWDRSVYPETD